ncbi:MULTISPECIES: type II secretion system secretin GspD [unclassified Acidovorax]|uniref:type II secretion system secretin GspD n=1 Tax=unclassified Acidovorax TaxID=2684926 RepID=UPI000B23FBA9|nr:MULTISPECIES: type II secretion system secretin GspD [unclassified Acidovorax]
MNLPRFGYSLLALAMLQGLSATSWAQAAPGAAAVPATPTQAAPAADAARVPPQAEPAETRPRVIRGNDQVIAPGKPAATLSGAPLTFSFEDAPVADVVRTVLGDIMGVPYVLHPPIAGTVTLASRNAIPPDQAVFLLESALQANGLALARDARGTYHVGRADMLRNIGSDVRQASPRAPLSPGFGAIVIPLNYIGAGEMASILRPMVPGDAIIRVDTVRNLLVMNGTRTQAEGWLELVNTFDVDLLKGMSVGVFPLKHASVKEIEAALRLVSGGGAAPAGGATGGAAGSVGTQAGAAGRGQAGNAGAAASAVLGEGNPLFGALRIMPIERINSILVVTPRAAYLDEARRWIERFDQPTDSGGEPQLYIYQVQNVNAKHLANVLSGIFGGQTSSTGNVANSGVAPGLSTATGNSFGQNSMSGGTFGNTNSSFGGGVSGGSFGTRVGSQSSGFNSLGNRNNQNNGVQQQAAAAASIGNIRVMADELNNSVLVWGTKSEYSKIEATLKRLDVPVTQVLIEATIVEVTLSDELEYGLQWAFNDNPTRNGSTYRGNGQLTNNANGIISGLAQGFSYTVGRSTSDIRATLNALATKSLVKVISSPSLMVLDNHTASIAVGNQQPVKTNTTTPITDITTGVTTSTIQYKDTGVNLTVTPSVNAGNLVTMQVDQTVTDVGADVPSADGQPAFLQRQISSKVAVRTGEAIVLGGLIKDNSNTGKSGVPFLQDVPLVGKLFGSNTVNKGRTELLVVITPRVVRTDIDIREVSEDLRDRLKGLKAIENLGIGTKAPVLDSVPQRSAPAN